MIPIKSLATFRKEHDMEIYFEQVDHEENYLKVPFTKESWHGRVLACRGVGASLSTEELARWDAEHRKLLENVPDSFDVLHYVALAVLKRKD